MNSVRFFEKLHEHATELGGDLLTLVGGIFWKFTPRGMEDGPLIYPVVTHHDRVFVRHFQVGLLLANFGFPSVTGPFQSSDEYIGCSREVLDIFNLIL